MKPSFTKLFPYFSATSYLLVDGGSIAAGVAVYLTKPHPAAYLIPAAIQGLVGVRSAIHHDKKKLPAFTFGLVVGGLETVVGYEIAQHVNGFFH